MDRRAWLALRPRLTRFGIGVVLGLLMLPTVLLWKPALRPITDEIIPRMLYFPLFQSRQWRCERSMWARDQQIERTYGRAPEDYRSPSCPRQPDTVPVVVWIGLGMGAWYGFWYVVLEEVIRGFRWWVRRLVHH